MVEYEDALLIFNSNIRRSKALIDVIDILYYVQNYYKINVLNNGLSLNNSKLKIDQHRLRSIEISCAEHAIVSICTAYESYYKSLLRQLIFNYPDYFINYETTKSKEIEKIINSEKVYTEENFERKLNLHNRITYNRLFKSYKINFLSEQNEKYVESLCKERNAIIHNKIRRKNLLRDKEMETIINITKSDALRHYNKIRGIIEDSHRELMRKQLSAES